MNADDLKLFTDIVNTGHASVTGTAQSGADDALQRLAQRHYPRTQFLGNCTYNGCGGNLFAPARRGMSARPYTCNACGKEQSLVVPGLLDFGKKSGQ